MSTDPSQSDNQKLLRVILSKCSPRLDAIINAHPHVSQSHPDHGLLSENVRDRNNAYVTFEPFTTKQSEICRPSLSFRFIMYILYIEFDSVVIPHRIRPEQSITHERQQFLDTSLKLSLYKTSVVRIYQKKTRFVNVELQNLEN